MDAEAVRAFASRDRTRLVRAKREHWAERTRALGPEEPMRALCILRDLVAAADRSWPTDADRQRDLAHHIRLKQDIDRAAHAVTRG